MSTSDSAGPSDPHAPQDPTPRGPGAEQVPSSKDLVLDAVISRPLAEEMAGAPADRPISVMIELRSDHRGGATGARAEVEEKLDQIAPGIPLRSTRAYVTVDLTPAQISDLARADAAAALGERPASEAQPRATPRGAAPRQAIHRMWPNFAVRGVIHRTVMTTKSDAAQRSFDASGQGIVWAVLDSGIAKGHRHFATFGTLELPGGIQHRSFLPGGRDGDALTDLCGHGTHVAGIIAGTQVADDEHPIVAASYFETDEPGEAGIEEVRLPRISGMAPRCTLVSCQVLREDGTGDVAALVEALEYVQDVNHGGRELNIHGVNLSVGYPFDPSWFATGLTPVCREVDRLVRSGVVVVVAAGNTGYGYALDAKQNRMRLGFDMTINDPGNAEGAITVGSTSTSPHSTGVSYFSSKGPTGDGRLKPDVVAPGERVVSAGAGRLLATARSKVPNATYVEDSGTSMSAPHVSGVAANFLSVHREFVGRPEDVKRILMETASDLGRVRTFQGRGLVDAMRAIQSV